VGLLRGQKYFKAPHLAPGQRSLPLHCRICSGS